MTITIDAVDTGERRTLGGYIARRVITTTKTESGRGTSVPASESTQDGWYIDLPSVPDTVMNRLQSYWDGARRWVDGRLRFVWPTDAR